MAKARTVIALTSAAAVLAGGAAWAERGQPAALTAGSVMSTGLPSVSGPRPGPPILYAKPPRAPQLENTGVWHAQPILVSGAQAYSDGEFVYQDYLYDDHGALGVKDNNDPYGASADLYSPPQGTFTYPTKKVYANNAADLVEFRTKPLAKATAFRVTFNTLLDPAKSAFTIALGSASSSVAWPFGAGISSPAQEFVTWHGSRADVTSAQPGKTTVLTGGYVHVDRLRRQITVVVPHSVWNPGRSTVRMTVGTGLWDAANNSYLKPQVGSATATTPGGGTPQGVAIVNVGPRLNEPLPLIAGATMGDTAVGGEALARFWRESQQATQLAQGDVTPFAAEVDFAKLLSKRSDFSGVPKSGPMDRIYASHYSFGQGYNPANVCYDLAAGFAAGAKCKGRMVGQLQPYALYVPKKPIPGRGYGMTLLLHSLSANYNQYLGSHNQSQVGERGPGSIVLTPSDRGPDGFYAGYAEADTFEAWADVARHYKLDPDWTTVTGYSMGGFGTYRLLARWPDLFSRGWSVVGAPGSVDDQLVSLRNTPLLLWNSTEDELVNISTSEQAVADDTAAGIRFTEDLFLTADHLTLAANDQFAPGAAWLGTARVDRDPAHITFVVDPTEDSAAAGMVSNHAYWLSGLTPRGKGDATIDVLSKAFGTGVPAVQPVQQGGGALTGGEIPAMVYVERSQSWGPTPKVAARNQLLISAKNLRSLTIDIARARVTCGVKLIVHTDGPLTVRLPACDQTLYFH
jgi:pimeloyl-ACP methyl ester carboxylesterase